ncbi:hypothetical protein [Mesomycoplasma molare]|uniref:DUF31 domain-containing protein n=1 Tax=Mesomycoplasma molare TaxID=171288 RepID=A0ABY5TU39_9BACT|nr:hypothetical protein [Mesomycoplasma molare]UWD34175.1 hypothetical protein NX772_03775 [Mesomycoplasma molare]
MKKSILKNFLKSTALVSLLALSPPIFNSCIGRNKNESKIPAVEDISFNSITATSASVVIQLNEPTLIEKTESNIELTSIINSVHHSIKVDARGKQVVFNFKNLHPDSRYFITSININNQKIIIPHKLKIDFQTLPKQKVLSIKSIGFFDIKQNEANLRINYESDSAIEFNKMNIIFDNPVNISFISNENNLVTFKLNGLTSNTTYKLKNITLENYKVNFNSNNSSFITLKNPTPDSPKPDTKPTPNPNNNHNTGVNDKDKPNPNPETHPNPQPDETPKKQFAIKNIKLLEIKTNKAKIRVNFSELEHQSQNTIFSMTLSNNYKKDGFNFNYAEQYVDFVFENLTPNTSYNIVNLKASGKPILNNFSFSFNTEENTTDITDNTADKEHNDNNNDEDNSTSFEEPSIVSRSPFYENEANIIEKNDSTFSDIKNDSDLSNYFTFIERSKTTEPNDNFPKYSQNEIISHEIKNNNLTIKVKLIEDYGDNFALKIQKSESTQKISPTKKENNIAEFLVSNIANGESIKIIGLFNGDDEIPKFKNKNYNIETKKTTEESDKFNFTNFTDWKLWVANTQLYSFSINAYKTASNIEWPNAFALKIVNYDNQIEYIDLRFKNRSENSPRTAEEYFEKSRVNKILGLTLKKGSQYYDITNLNNKIEKPDVGQSEAVSNFNINSINLEGSTIKINYLNSIDTSINSVKFLIKSLNPFQPWSKIITANIDHGNKTATFSNNEIAKNISEYIIVSTQLKNEVIDYGLNPKYKFKFVSNDKSINLLDLKIIKDQQNKQLFASAKFDLNNNDMEFLKGKWIQFVFEPEVNAGQEEYYGLNFVKDYKINVPFENLWKFGLNGFYENTKYILKSIKAIEPFTQNDYYDNFSISNSDNSFIYKFDYQNITNNKLIKNNNFSDSTLSDSDLITRNKNLTRQDLINFWLSNETKSKIPYSPQNHWALIEYERYHFYKSAAGDIKRRKNFILVDYNGNEVHLRLIAGRKILNNAIPVISEDHKKVTITEDLGQYTGLENIKDSAIFIFRMELDNQKRKLTETTPLDPASTSAKSFVNVAISYKDLKEKRVIEEAPFSFLQTRGDIRIHETIYKQLNDRFKFTVRLEDNKIKLEIIPKYNNVLIFDTLYDHYFSLANSTFIGNISTTLHWIKSQDHNNEITFRATPLDNNISLDLEETFIDNTNKENDKLFQKEIKLKHKEQSVKRLYKKDVADPIDNMRKRSFSFHNGSNGTWSVLGKVKPDDDTDYNYYVISNSHVWKVFPPASGITADGNEYKILSNTRFKIPVVLEEPADRSLPHIQPHFNSIDTLNLDGVDFKLESVVDFDNDNFYPNANIFKDTYGDSIKISNGHDPWLLGRADLIVAKVDMSFFFKNFNLETLDSAYYNGRPLNDRQKEIVKFFLNWKTLPMEEISPYNLHLSEYYNLNWFTATYPGLASNNKDSLKGKRYREYLLGNTDFIFDSVNYLGATSRNLLVKWDTKLIDSAGGSSGTTVYDSNGKIAGFIVESTRGAKKDEEGVAGIFAIDGQKYKFFGDGTTPQNPASFYERARLLSYLYPERYDGKNFTKKPKFYNAIEKNNVN